MAISSTSTSGIFNIFYRNLQKKEAAVILKRIGQLLQNLVRVHNMVGFLEKRSCCNSQTHWSITSKFGQSA